MSFPIDENITLPILRRLSRFTLVKTDEAEQIAADYSARLQVKSAGLDQLVSALSGGNQQKVVLGKWLATDPHVLILDKPTRGIDIGTKAEVHRIISHLATQGLAILMISSELPEILGMSDRVLVMHEGRISGEFDRNDADQERIMLRQPVRSRWGFQDDQRHATRHDPRAHPRGRSGGRTDGDHRRRYDRQPRFTSVNNIRQILLSVSILAIVAIGQTLVVLTRNIDLSVASIVGLVAYEVRDILAHNPQMSIGLAIVIGLLIGAGLGAVNGALVTVGRVPAIVATLGTLYVFRGLTFALGGGKLITASQEPPDFKRIALSRPWGIPAPIIIAAVLGLVFTYLLKYSRVGRQLYAIGSNPDAARPAGIRTNRVVFGAYVMCGLLCGVGGVLWGSRFGSIDARAASGMELQVVAAVVLGGVNIFGGSGTIVGAMLGAVLLGTIQNALTILRLNQFWIQAISGAAILLAVTIDLLITRRLRRSLTLRRAV